MTELLALYSRVTKDDIRHNRGNVAERLGFLGRLIHGVSPGPWLRELKARWVKLWTAPVCGSKKSLGRHPGIADKQQNFSLP